MPGDIYFIRHLRGLRLFPPAWYGATRRRSSPVLCRVSRLCHTAARGLSAIVAASFATPEGVVDTNTRRRAALTAYQIGDVLAFAACVCAVLRFEDAHVAAVRVSPLPLAVWMTASCLALHATLAGAGVYASQRLARALPLRAIFAGLTLGVSAAAAGTVFLDQAFRLAAFVHLWVLTACAMIAPRLVLRYALRGLRQRGRNLRYAILVGSGARAARLLAQLQQPATGYRVLGYVDSVKDALEAHRGGLCYLGPVERLPAIIAGQPVDEVFVTLPVRSCYDDIARTIAACENQGVPVRLPADFFRSAISEQRIGEDSVVSFLPSPVSAPYLVVKRLVDLCVSAALLVACAPLLCAIAVAIKRDSPGPVFFVQPRVGRGKRPFPLVKFRTMQVRSESRMAELAHLNEAHGPVFKIRQDPRVTPLGRFLRRTSLDELPQLLNVFLGHMSLVGPRPLPLRDVAGFTVDWQRRRFSVKPGITCLWQISGRSELTFEQWMKLDMLYIDRRSLLLDMEILLMTVPAVFAQRGAY